jgi:hypothetical protein
VPLTGQSVKMVAKVLVIRDTTAKQISPVHLSHEENGVIGWSVRQDSDGADPGVKNGSACSSRCSIAEQNLSVRRQRRRFELLSLLLLVLPELVLSSLTGYRLRGGPIGWLCEATAGESCKLSSSPTAFVALGLGLHCGQAFRGQASDWAKPGGSAAGSCSVFRKGEGSHIIGGS